MRATCGASNWARGRSKLFSPPTLLGKLAGAPLLEVLAGGPRDHTDRQRTLRGAITWSYNLLEPAEQQLFRRLATFVGGRPVEAVEAVCNAAGDLGIDVGEGLLALVEHSLVHQQEGADGEPRFWMLVTIHSYAQERLAASGEADAIRRRHAEYYLDLAEAAAPHLRGAEQQQWLDRLDSEHDNLRAALGWLVQQGAGEAAQRLAGALWRFWMDRGYLTEGRAWLARTAHDGRTSARALVCLAGGHLAQIQSDYATARTLLDEALDLCRELGDQPTAARAWNILGIVEKEQGHLAAAQQALATALALDREQGNRWGVAAALSNLGMVALPLLREVGNVQHIGYALGGLAFLAVREEQPEQAARLLGAADTVLRSVQVQRSAYSQQEHDQYAARVRERLGDARFAALWREGSRMSVADAIRAAIGAVER